ncbi:hypothetical protein [Methylobacterium sp. Leaf125]|uniref:hypothetical protein n=1 Tax=Methylobacterium sp. Leaf125 TaxID=1736265 RepID=UPI000A8DBAAF|nr:hypothetical protein [Methylobacterium sp. Leaf125]
MALAVSGSPLREGFRCGLGAGELEHDTLQQLWGEARARQVGDQVVVRHGQTMPQVEANNCRLHTID